MNIYLGNLPYGITEGDLTQLFEAYGTVNSVRIVTDKFSGKSKGFGFIEMPENENAKKAIAELNGKEVKGRNITVNEARERSEERPGGGRGRGFRS